MKFKKLASLALACVMCVSLAVPAFAADNETNITATYTPPVISVVVPQTAAAFINPLGLDIKVDATNGPTLSGRQIISAPMTLKNQSASDLQVGATVSVTVNDSSDLRFVSTSTGGASAATKSVFAYVQAIQEKTLVGSDTSGVAATDIATAYGNWEASAYDSTKDIVVNSAMPATKDNLVILRAADMTGSNGAFKAYKAGSVALVRLAGDCTSTLTTGDGWVKTETTGSGDTAVTTGDGFTVNVAYTFKPASITKYDVTVDTSAITATAGNYTNFTVSDAKAAAGDTVTLTLTGINGVSKAKVTVKDTAATPAAVTTNPADGVVQTTNDTVSFVMPEGGVTITVAPTT